MAVGHLDSQSKFSTEGSFELGNLDFPPTDLVAKSTQSTQSSAQVSHLFACSEESGEVFSDKF